MNIDEQCFDNFDLNLIVIFLVLFREQSVSKTALRLKVSQPAVSNSLARLRLRFNDPLFLRAGRGVRPTPEATKIAETLMPAIRSIETVLTIVSGRCHWKPAVSATKVRMIPKDLKSKNE